MMSISMMMMKFSFFLTFSHLRSSILLIDADPSSCRKQVECFVCDSRVDPACEDARTFAHRNVTIQLCDDYCLKMWTRENDSLLGDDRTEFSRYVRRGCHKIVRYQIKKAETCYRHKKHASDSFCLCASDRCNSSSSLRQTWTTIFFAALFSMFSAREFLLYSDRNV